MTRGNTAPLRNKNGQNFPEHRELDRERTREEGRSLRQNPREQLYVFKVLQRLKWCLLDIPHSGVGGGWEEQECRPAPAFSLAPAWILPPSQSLLCTCKSVLGALICPVTLCTCPSLLEFPVYFSVTSKSIGSMKARTPFTLSTLISPVPSIMLIHSRCR